MFIQELLDLKIEVLEDKSYEQNVSGMKRNIKGVILPKNTHEVSLVVKLANTHHQYLYPISAGKNWAFGSRLPVKEDSFVIDLKNLSEIFEINLELGYAVIGTGVTQYQLQKKVDEMGGDYFLDVTGSGRETSIIGNALDRGIAYNSLRADDLISCEAVLGTGEVIPLATAQFESSSTKELYKHGLGPNLNCLWQQSNFSIVTKATYRLHRRSEDHLFFQVRFNDSSLGEVMTKVHELKAQGILSGIIHIPDRMRSLSSIMPEVVDLNPELSGKVLEDFTNKKFKSDWTAFGQISGALGSLTYKKKFLKKVLSPVAKVKIFSLRNIQTMSKFYSLTGNKIERDFLQISHELVSLSIGKSTDLALKVLSWLPKHNKHQNLDSNENGLLFCVPIFPFTGRDSVRVHEIINSYKKQYSDIFFGTTLNTLNDSVVEAVISLSFDKATQAVDAQACLKKLYADLAKENYLPYRLNIDNMQDYIDESTPYWKAVKAIKESLDPNGVLAPGRYCP